MAAATPSAASPRLALDPEAAGHNRHDTILIAGAGIGGLAAAIALARRGLASHVLERRPVFSEEGAGIQIGPNGTRILRDLGLAAALAPMAGVPDVLKIMDGVGGGEIATLPLGDWIAARHGAPYWTLHRADLHAALLQQARREPLIRLTLSADLVGVAERGDTIEAETADGAVAVGRALIGADGLWSQTRDYIRGRELTLTFSGTSALRTVLPASALPAGLSKNATHLWLRPGAHVVHYPVRAGEDIAIVLIVDDREQLTGWGTDVLSAYVHTRTGGFPHPLADLLTIPKAWRKWSLHALERGEPRRWVRGRAALLGDAAHPVFPYLAQGGVLALEDAAVLARVLSEQGADVPRALVAYQGLRKGRARRVARASRRNGGIYHMSGMMAAARDSVMRTLPAERLMGGFDWLYGWRT